MAFNSSNIETTLEPGKTDEPVVRCSGGYADLALLRNHPPRNPTSAPTGTPEPTQNAISPVVAPMAAPRPIPSVTPMAMALP